MNQNADDGADVRIDHEAAAAANRDLWNDRAVLHEDLYDAHALARDPRAITQVVRDDVPVLAQHLSVSPDERRPLAGFDILHLQCHIGTDTLSLARLGARVTGVDFSPAALEVAGRLADEAGLSVHWVESDALAARAAVAGDFDVVYTSIGTIVWFEDLTTWAGQIAALLRPGGIFFIRDGHPALYALDEKQATPTVAYRYFANGRAQTWDDGATYAGEGTTTHTRSYEWPHALSEIVTALLNTGLVVERFDEGKTLPWRQFEQMTLEDGSYAFDERWRDKIPCTYTFVARKAADA